MIESGTLVSLEEFKSNQKLKESVKNGIKGLVKLLFQEAGKIIKFTSNDDLIFQLMKLGLISATLAQELLDILKIVNNLDLDLCKNFNPDKFGQNLEILQPFENSLINSIDDLVQGPVDDIKENNGLMKN